MRWIELEDLTGQEEAFALALVRPLVANLSSGFAFVDTDRHGPALGAQAPLLNQLRVHVRAVDRFGGGLEPSLDDDLGLAFSRQHQLAHRLLSFPFACLESS